MFLLFMDKTTVSIKEEEAARMEGLLGEMDGIAEDMVDPLEEMVEDKAAPLAVIM